MEYNILGVNPGHNGSAALVSKGEVLYYLEEERLSRQKYDGNPFRAIYDIISKYHIDEIVIGGTTSKLPTLPWTGGDPYSEIVKKYYPNVKVSNLGDEHHLGHAATAFYNSGFDKAIAIVVDGAGSLKREKMDEYGQWVGEGYETESIWVCEYPGKFSVVRKVHSQNVSTHMDNGLFQFDNSITVTKAYEAVSQYLGFGFIEAGKTMGLAPYGEDNPEIPRMFLGNRASKDFFVPNYPAGAFVDQSRLRYVFDRGIGYDPKNWHNNPHKLLKIEKDLAWKVQQETQKIVGDYIEYAVGATGIKDVVICGGYGLNCVANYYFLKRFPDVNIYCEPVAHDGGTAIGLAMLAWHQFNCSGDAFIPRQSKIYYGPQYEPDVVQKALDDNAEKISVTDITAQEVAQLISERNIVSIFQGRSEAGPRALGNRSILYDPRDPDGKDYVNTVKGREWFRPFAGTVLKEHANDWFDMAGLDESPFMMYAVNVAADKVSTIPCITHVDDTCRVQTVTEEQNKHFYNLINEFYKITEVPILFNTSFNLAGDPLVETIDDALSTLYRSKLKYLYLPELGKLITKTIEDPVVEEDEGDPYNDSTDIALSD
jgi:carbamoyltransferase